MATILILYSTVDGHTRKICETLARQWSTAHATTVLALDAAGATDLDAFDAIVLGASIRYGKHRPAVIDFGNRHAALLARKVSALFSVNIVARKPNKNTPDTNPYLRKLLARIAWRPNLLGVFAGKLDYPAYSPLDRLMIRFIMLITKGPTDPSAVVEFTDWEAVRRFGESVDAACRSR